VQEFGTSSTWTGSPATRTRDYPPARLLPRNPLQRRRIPSTTQLPAEYSAERDSASDPEAASTCSMPSGDPLAHRIPALSCHFSIILCTLSERKGRRLSADRTSVRRITGPTAAQTNGDDEAMLCHCWGLQRCLKCPGRGWLNHAGRPGNYARATVVPPFSRAIGVRVVVTEFLSTPRTSSAAGYSTCCSVWRGPPREIPPSSRIFCHFISRSFPV
jgi:hypothetical protein